MQIYWYAQTGLQYQLRRAGLGVSYFHGVSGGSGVLAGSISDTVTGTVNPQMSRSISGAINFGYSRNNGFNTVGSTFGNQTYSYWFGGATLSRQLGRTLSLNLSYQAQFQDSNVSFCVGPACGTSLIRHLVSFGVGWNKRPIPLR